MLGVWLLGKSPIWSQPDSDLIFVPGSPKSLFWLPSARSPQPMKSRWVFTKTTLLVASLSPQLPFCFVVFIWTPGHFRLSGLTQGEHHLIQCLPVLHVLVPHRGENRILFSFKSYNVVGAHVFLSLIFHIYWAFIPYPMFFGEHFLGGGCCVHVKAPAKMEGHCSVKWGDWLILSRAGLVLGGWQERESTVDQE